MCGKDGVTYKNKCLAKCNKVVKLKCEKACGECEVAKKKTSGNALGPCSWQSIHNYWLTQNICSPGGCKCAPGKDGPTCCAKGGSWFGKCGPNREHSWTEGAKACEKTRKTRSDSTCSTHLIHSLVSEWPRVIKTALYWFGWIDRLTIISEKKTHLYFLPITHNEMWFASQHASAVLVNPGPVVVAMEGPGKASVDVLVTANLSIHGPRAWRLVRRLKQIKSTWLLSKSTKRVYLNM